MLPIKPVAGSLNEEGDGLTADNVHAPAAPAVQRGYPVRRHAQQRALRYSAHGLRLQHAGPTALHR